MHNKTRRIKIAFLTEAGPRDRGPWSGTTYYIAQALQQYCGEVTFIGPLPAYKAKLGERILNKGSRLLLKQKYFYQHGITAAKWYGKVASQKLAAGNFDVIVVAEGAIATTIIAFLETDTPIVCVHDVTFALLHDYYQYFSNLLGRSFRELNTVEALAIRKASLLVYSSAWAARSAVHDYQADPGKVHVVPFGANLETIPAEQVVEARKKSGRCRLLFIGAAVEWQRKGGDIAFETLVKLEEKGVTAELIVCGCTPPDQLAHDRMTVIPFLDKSDARQRQQLEQLYAISDFLLVPTRADCTPIVFCEANAFGLPIISTRTGAVAEVVKDSENGFLLPYEARGEAYAEVIARVYHDDERYTELVRASRAAFEDRLNWDAWGAAVKQILADLLARKSPIEIASSV